MECAVCLDKNNLYYRCNNIFCMTSICVECFDFYLNHIYNNSEMPVCVGKSCEYYYLYSDILEKDKQLYIDILCRSLNKTANLTAPKVDVISILREEKKKFILANYPPSIYLVADICMKKKINAIVDKKNKCKKATYKVCMNSFCDGHLDSDLKCNKCSSTFCNKCEKILSPSHVCNEDDIKSIMEIKSLPTCPNCGANLDKDEMCNHVMCGICGTKFIYRTDQVGGGGGHTKMVKIKEKVTLSVQYSSILSQKDIDIILLIEGKKILGSNISSVMNSLKEGSKSNIGKVFETYARKKFNMQRYMEYLSEIEKRILDRSLTTQYLVDVLNTISSF